MSTQNDEQLKVVTDKIEAIKVDTASDKKEDEDFVDPWNVVSTSDKGIDYDKLISKILYLMAIHILLLNGFNLS